MDVSTIHLKTNHLKTIQLKRVAQKGIYALASSSIENKNPQSNNGNWFLGHIGASLIASALMCHRQLIKNSKINEAILKRVDNTLSNYKDFIYDFENSYFQRNVDQKNADQTTQEILSADQSSQTIVEAISLQQDQLWASGHNVIYAALVLDAINEFQLNVEKQVITNIINLIKNCEKDNPKRYFGIADYRELNIERTTIENWDEFYKNAITQATTNVYLDMEGHFLAGEKLHIITHAHAIYLFKKLGFEQLAQSFASVLLKKIQLSDLHPENAKRLKSAEYDENNLEDWDIIEGNDDVHQIKLIHSFYELNESLKLSHSSLDALWGVFKVVGK